MNAIVARYIDCIEEIININTLISRLEESVQQGHLNDILIEIVKQSRLEFNYEDLDALPLDS